MRTALVLAIGTRVGAAALGQTPVSPTHPLFESPTGRETPCTLPWHPFDDRTLWEDRLWPGGVVHYTLDPNVNATNAARFRIALAELETVCNVSFVVRTNQLAYIHVQNSTGNSSFVGRLGGEQTLNLVNWNIRYIIIHELMHALGVYHEQQRWDREGFVTINEGRIQPAYFDANFPILNATPQGAYDFESIMHYDECSFSTCCAAGTSCNCPSTCRAIDVKPGYEAFATLMGNRSYMSQGDKDGLVSRYGAPPDDALAPNFTLATARPIALATTYNLRLLTTSDYFSVDLPTSTTLVVRVPAATDWAPSNANIRILSPGGGQIAQAFFLLSAGKYVATASRALAPGRYVIQVTRTQPWGGFYAVTASTSCAASDLTADGIVDDADFPLFLVAYDLMLCTDPAMPAGCPADTNRDGQVNDADFLFFAAAYSTSLCP